MQFSLFGAAAIEPSRADLDGLLLGGAHWVRSGNLRPHNDRPHNDRPHNDRPHSDRAGRDDSGRQVDHTPGVAGTGGTPATGGTGGPPATGGTGGPPATGGQPGPPGPPRTAGTFSAAAGTGQERARLSVLVQPGWRVEALAEEFARRDLDGEVAEAQGGLIAVRTPFLAELVPAAERWTRGALLAPPPGLVLSAGGLRLWAVAAGRTDDVGYLLGTPSLDHPVHRAGGAQLAAAGLAAVSIGERGGPGWRITGLKRVRRLAELLGEPPTGAGRAWPG